ncbi:MAG: TniB family NTP-binding protein [bacterium]
MNKKNTAPHITDISGCRLIPKSMEYLEKSDEERIGYIKKERFIVYTSAQKVLGKLEELLIEPKKSRMPCLLIVGDSNNGKTSVVKKFFKAHMPTDGIETDAVPVIIIQAPPRPDTAMFYDSIMDEILIPFKKSDTLSRKEAEITYYFSKLGTKMLIVDEIHNILSGSVAKQKEFMNALKNLNNKLSLPIVLVGIKEALNATNTDFQISSRFKPLYLKRWNFGNEYLSLLKSIEKILPLKKESNLAENSKLAEIIIESSEGLLGEIIEIINLSAIESIKNQKERITMDEIRKTGYVQPSLRRSIDDLEAV